MQTVISKPSIHTFVVRGRVFQLLSGGETRFNFRGVGDEWSEEVVLVPGDSLKFDRDFYNIEISSEYEQKIEFYAGYADMRRASTDLKPVGASSAVFGSVTAEKVQKQLVDARRNRRSVTVLPLDAMVYIGGLNQNINQQTPIAAGQPVTLDVTSSLYVTLNPAHAQDTADVRIIEEIN